jgi:segregation and condensation protein B
MSKNIKQQVESLLLVATKPLKVVKLKDFIPEATPEEIMAAVAELKEKYNQPDSGLNILENQGVIQLTTCPAVSATVKEFVKDETTGELTRPALETLTIIAYRQPISKSELEQIRGVNCSLILRNLLIRGLILKKEDKRALTNYYCVTVDFLKFLGINSVTELPDYAKLNNNPNLQKLFDSDLDEGSEEPLFKPGEVGGDDESVAATSGAENSGETSSDEGAEKDSTEPVRLKVNVYS